MAEEAKDREAQAQEDKSWQVLGKLSMRLSQKRVSWPSQACNCYN